MKYVNAEIAGSVKGFINSCPGTYSDFGSLFACLLLTFFFHLCEYVFGASVLYAFGAWSLESYVWVTLVGA